LHAVAVRVGDGAADDGVARQQRQCAYVQRIANGGVNRQRRRPGVSGIVRLDKEAVVAMRYVEVKAAILWISRHAVPPPLAIAEADGDGKRRHAAVRQRHDADDVRVGRQHAKV
jgi:hypothetical protein